MKILDLSQIQMSLKQVKMNLITMKEVQKLDRNIIRKG